MLPDFPSIKDELHEAITLRLRMRVRTGDPVIAMVGHTLQHEGDRKSYETVERKQKQLDYKRSEASFLVTREQVRSLTLPEILEKVDAAADEMVRQMATSMFARIGLACEEIGNTIDQQGRPFTFDSFLEGLEMVEIDFDDQTGEPKMPTMVVHPALGAKLKDKFPEWERDEQCRTKFETLVKRKKAEWHDRESRRKLVD